MLAKRIGCALVLLAPWSTPWSQEPRLEGTRLEAAVEELATKLESVYVFADQGARMAQQLRERLWAGAYEDRDLGALSGLLTADLRSINGDRHLRVFPLPRSDEEPEPERLQRLEAESSRRGNHGFQKLEVLDGNVGYLELRGFASTEVARATAVGAMAFFAEVDALIIDLRRNGGGDPSMIQLLCTYFFEKPTLLNTFEWRGKLEREETWTLPEVPGKERFDVPLFVLTSGNTFSAAEEFSYDLQCLKRATVVGATTGGGAHPGDTHPIAGGLAAFIPNGRAINPITGTNWEGTGVTPDIEVPVAGALERALDLARIAAEERRGTRAR